MGSGDLGGKCEQLVVAPSVEKAVLERTGEEVAPVVAFGQIALVRDDGSASFAGDQDGLRPVQVAYVIHEAGVLRVGEGSGGNRHGESFQKQSLIQEINYHEILLCQMFIPLANTKEKNYLVE